MMRKLIVFIAGLLFILAILLAAKKSAVAALPDSGNPPPERMRPDQYAYPHQELIPYLNLQPQPRPDLPSSPLDSPVAQWSRMTFQTYETDGWEVMTANGSFSDLLRLTYNDVADLRPRFNRGGTRLVFMRDSGYAYEIHTMNPDGSNLVRLTTEGYDDVEPVWSPDGTKIAFQSYRDGNAEVYVMNADGSGQTNLSQSADYDGIPSWSPDGSRLAFVSRRTGGYRIWAMDADGANLVILSDQPYSENPVWSPDGSKIGFDAAEGGGDWEEIWWMNSDGTNQTKVVPGDYGWHHWANGWSPDGKLLLFSHVHVIYYYGHWYWNFANLCGVNKDWNTVYINPGRTTDWELDWNTTDVQPPQTGMYPLGSPLPYQFTVSWWGQDAVAGMYNYDVQVMDGVSGWWTDWRTKTTQTSGVYSGLGGHTYSFRVRGTDKAFNVQPWPDNYQVSTTVESVPPITAVFPLHPLTRGNTVSVAWDGYDMGGSDIKDYDIQYRRDADGVWTDWLVGTISNTVQFSGDLGHTYWFRSRGRDNGLTVEAWPAGDGDASIAFYAWRSMGIVRDHTGTPITGAAVTSNPPALLTSPSDRDGLFSAYLGENFSIKSLSWSKDGYGALPPTQYGLPDANVEVYLPPVENQVQDGGFESGNLPGAWQVGGTLTPTLDQSYVHSGAYAASLGTALEFGSPVQFVADVYAQPERLAYDSQGGAHIAWGVYENGYRIYYSHRSPDHSWSSPELVTEPAFSAYRISIFIDADLNVHLVYFDDPDGIYYTWRNSSGIWTEPLLIDNGAWLCQALQGPSSIHLLWTAGPAGSSQLYYASLEFGGEWQIEQVPFVSNLNQVSMALDSAGTVHLVWTSSDGYTGSVNYKTRDANGWSARTVQISAGVFPFSIQILLDAQGTSHVAWVESGDRSEFFYSRQQADGSWTPPYKVSENLRAHYIHVLFDEQENLYFFWAGLGQYPSEWGIYYSVLNHLGIWSYPIRIPQTTDYASSLSASVSGGDVYIVWNEPLGDNNTEIYYSRLHAGTWSAPLQLTHTDFYSEGPLIEVDPLGGINLLWVEMDNYTFRDLYYMDSLPLPQSQQALLSQSFTIPISMTNPTLSFMSTLNGLSQVSGNQFSLLLSTDVLTTTLFTSTTPTGWERLWFDLSPWSGEVVTVTFYLSETAGYPPASALIDEVALGAAHTDAWVELTGGRRSAHLGEQFDLQLAYGNRSGVIASGTLMTVTLPLGLSYVDASLPPQVIGDQLVWQLGDLAPGSRPEPIRLTLRVDENAPLVQYVVSEALISTTSPELETVNNRSLSEIYLGYLVYLPHLRK